MTTAKQPAASSASASSKSTLGVLVAAALDAVAAEDVLALRGEADVAHDRNAGADEQLDLGGHRPAALELDRVRHPLLHEAGRRRERLLRLAW